MATLSTYQGGTFVGISHLWFIKGGFGNKFDTTGKDVLEVPVAQDGGFTYSGGSPSINHYKVHGITGDWTSRMTPGDTDINLFIPCIDEEVLTNCGFTKTVIAAADAAKVAPSDGNVGDYKWVPATSTPGFSFAEVNSAFTVGIAAANDEGTKLFCIKKVKLLASILFDAADTAKPIGITLVGSSSASTSSDAMGIFEGRIGIVSTERT